jgi:hypothetical protein
MALFCCFGFLGHNTAPAVESSDSVRERRLTAGAAIGQRT